MHDNIDEVTAQKILRYAKLASKNATLMKLNMPGAILQGDVVEMTTISEELGMRPKKILELAAQNLQKDKGCG